MSNQIEKNWRVVQTIELNASVEEVWDLVGGFFTIHLWHPDITQTQIPEDQTSQHEIRRILTFPGQPVTTEQLVFIDNPNFYYRYKWYAGPWGEMVKNYHAEIKVVEIEIGKSCLVQWSSTFLYTEDALTQFYLNGLNALKKKFG